MVKLNILSWNLTTHWCLLSLSDRYRRGHTGWVGGNSDLEREISLVTWLYPFSPTLAINTVKICTSRDKGQPWVSTELSTLISPVRAGTHNWLLSFLLLCFSLAGEEPWAVFPLAVPSTDNTGSEADKLMGAPGGTRSLTFIKLPAALKGWSFAAHCTLLENLINLILWLFHSPLMEWK